MDVARLEKDEEGLPYIQLGENILRLEHEAIDDRYRELARQQIRETPENVENGLQILRKLIEEEPGLNVPLDNDFLLTFLRPCKFYPESAFKIMKKYYKFKLKHPKYSTDLLPHAVSKVFDDWILYFLPKRCKNGERIMVINPGAWNTKEVPVVMFLKAILLAVDIAMNEPKTQVSGVYIILDMEGLSASHVWQFTPSLAKLILNVVQECLALRLLSYHIINQSVIFEVLYKIFKPFIGEKLRNKIYFHGCDWASMHKIIDSDCLPSRWGGTLKSPDCPGHMLSQVLLHFESEYEKRATYGYKKESDEADG